MLNVNKKIFRNFIPALGLSVALVGCSLDYSNDLYGSTGTKMEPSTLIDPGQVPTINNGVRDQFLRQVGNVGNFVVENGPVIIDQISGVQSMVSPSPSPSATPGGDHGSFGGGGGTSERVAFKASPSTFREADDEFVNAANIILNKLMANPSLSADQKSLVYNIGAQGFCGDVLGLTDPTSSGDQDKEDHPLQDCLQIVSDFSLKVSTYESGASSLTVILNQIPAFTFLVSDQALSVQTNFSNIVDVYRDLVAKLGVTDDHGIINFIPTQGVLSLVYNNAQVGQNISQNISIEVLNTISTPVSILPAFRAVLGQGTKIQLTPQLDQGKNQLSVLLKDTNVFLPGSINIFLENADAEFNITKFSTSLSLGFDLKSAELSDFFAQEVYLKLDGKTYASLSSVTPTSTTVTVDDQGARIVTNISNLSFLVPATFTGDSGGILSSTISNTSIDVNFFQGVIRGELNLGSSSILVRNADDSTYASLATQGQMKVQVSDSQWKISTLAPFGLQANAPDLGRMRGRDLSVYAGHYDINSTSPMSVQMSSISENAGQIIASIPNLSAQIPGSAIASSSEPTLASLQNFALNVNFVTNQSEDFMFDELSGLVNLGSGSLVSGSSSLIQWAQNQAVNLSVSTIDGGMSVTVDKTLNLALTNIDWNFVSSVRRIEGGVPDLGNVTLSMDAGQINIVEDPGTHQGSCTYNNQLAITNTKTDSLDLASSLSHFCHEEVSVSDGN